MKTVEKEVATWVEQARTKLANGGLQDADLDELLQVVGKGEAGRRKVTRQRLLYLHAATPNIQSAIVGMALHEPVEGAISQLDVTCNEWPYNSVREAIMDGWQVVHFPNQLAPFDDREIDILGYEFILQKLEEYDD